MMLGWPLLQIGINAAQAVMDDPAVDQIPSDVQAHGGMKLIGRLREHLMIDSDC